MSIGYGIQTVYTKLSEVTGPSGWYTFQVGSYKFPVYVDTTYSGGNWGLVMCNNEYTGGMQNLKWHDAINTANYRHSGVNDSINYKGMGQQRPTLDKFNCWIGLNLWKHIAANPSLVEVTQFAAGTKGTSLTGTHSERMYWTFTGWTSNYGFVGVANGALQVDTSALGNSGMYINMLNSVPLSTIDADHDTNAGSCASYYNNNPWFYTSCWSGNYFAGGSYNDRAHWVGSSAGNSRVYGAVYIR